MEVKACSFACLQCLYCLTLIKIVMTWDEMYDYDYAVLSTELSFTIIPSSPQSYRFWNLLDEQKLK